MDRAEAAFLTTISATIVVAAPLAVVSSGLGPSPWGSRYSYDATDVLIFQLLFGTVTVVLALAGVVAGVRVLRGRTGRVRATTAGACAMSLTWGLMALLVFNGN